MGYTEQALSSAGQHSLEAIAGAAQTLPVRRADSPRGNAPLEEASLAAIVQATYSTSRVRQTRKNGI